MAVDIPDYSDSGAILVGVSAYHDARYPALPAAANSLREMQDVLTDPALCGWPADRVAVCANPESVGRFAHQIWQTAERVRGILLLYFVGHGTITRRGQLCLALTDTNASGPQFTGLEYSKIRDILLDSPARTKVVILDCCYSGRAIEVLAGAETQIADSTDIRGVYTLTAADHAAHVPPPEEQQRACTSFTSEFTDLLRRGVPDGPPFLTLNALYGHLVHRLATASLPRPNQRGTDTADRYPFARNTAAGGVGAPKPRTRQIPWRSMLEQPHTAARRASSTDLTALDRMGPDQAAEALYAMKDDEAFAVLDRVDLARATSLLNRLPAQLATTVLERMTVSRASAILAGMDPDEAESAMYGMGEDRVVAAFDRMDVGRAALLLGRLSAYEVTKILDTMGETKALTILDRLGMDDLASVLDAWEEDQAASALEQMSPRRAASALGQVSLDRTATILGRMAPDLAARVVDRMGSARAASAFALMGDDLAARIRTNAQPD